MDIKTTRDLRKFLADTMVMVRDKKVDPTQANAIAKLCAQVNNSLAIEVNAAVKRGVSPSENGSPLALTDETPTPDPVNDDLIDPPSTRDFGDSKEVWCDQCDELVPVAEAAKCKSKFCKAGK